MSGTGRLLVVTVAPPRGEDLPQLASEEIAEGGERRQPAGEVGAVDAERGELHGEVAGEDVDDPAADDLGVVVVGGFDVPGEDPGVQRRRLRPDLPEVVVPDVFEAGQRE